MPDFSMIVLGAVDASDVPRLLTVLGISVAVLLVMILVLRIQAFVALLVASIVVGIGAGMDLTLLANEIIKGMGSGLGFIAAVIGVGAIFGQIMEHSGGAQALSKSLLGFFGEKRSSWAMVITGFIVSVPVFFDVGLVILAPILYSLARSTGKSVLYFGLPLIAGMAVTHAFVPPTPGPVWVSYQLGVGLGWVIIFGAAVGFPTAVIAGIFLARKMGEKLMIEPPELEEDELDHSSLPKFSTIILLIGLPILLIVAATVVTEITASGLDRTAVAEKMENDPSLSEKDARGAVLKSMLLEIPLYQKVIVFIGHPMVALLLATLLSLYFLGIRRGATKQQLCDLSTKALGPAGVIILITGAGGVFKHMMIKTGVGDALKAQFADSGLHVLLVAFILTLLVRLAQGSATVAMVMGAGLMASIIDGAGYSQAQLALITVTIAAAATAVSHVNDSGFWMVNRYLGMTEKQTLKTWTVITTVIAGVGFGIASLLWMFVS